MNINCMISIHSEVIRTELVPQHLDHVSLLLLGDTAGFLVDPLHHIQQLLISQNLHQKGMNKLVYAIKKICMKLR